MYALVVIAALHFAIRPIFIEASPTASSVCARGGLPYCNTSWLTHIISGAEFIPESAGSWCGNRSGVLVRKSGCPVGAELYDAL